MAAAAAVRVLPSLTWSSLPALKTPRSFRRLPRRRASFFLPRFISAVAVGVVVTATNDRDRQEERRS